ncbi:MAG: formate dehydrogenase subunit alpha [Chloroflexi bacterium]|nr:formate dehydrogenase subunit alpha [Chloroflexota bacterium]
MKRIKTVCPYCGCGCSYFLSVNDGKIAGVSPNKNHIISRGKLCIKGWQSAEFIDRPDRLTTPLIREGEGFREAGWDEALSLIADELSYCREKFGPDSIGIFSSAKCSNEENYLLQKFARAVIYTNNVDHCARLCHASTVAGLARAFGSGAMTNSIPDIAESDIIFIIGSNPGENHPLVASRIIQAVRERGAGIILADPRGIDLMPFVNVHMAQRPGTDVALINAMMHVILEEGLEDREFINSRTEGIEALEEKLKEYTPERAEPVTGVPADDIRKSARLYAGAGNACIIYAMGITQHSTGTDNVLSLANLAMLCGHIGKPGTGVNPLRGQNNVQGACDMGALPDVFPGYQKVDDPGTRKKFEEAWGRRLPETPGMTVIEMMNGVLTNDIRGMYFMGENPAVSDPDISHVIEALKALEFLAVQDIFLSETARFANVVLPAASYAEKMGTFTNTDRRVQVFYPAVEPPGEAKADWKIICEISSRMGYAMKYNSPAEIMEEIASLTPSYGGMSYDRLGPDGLQWPCTGREHPGTPILHTTKFTHGRGKFHAIDYLPPAEEPDEEYPFSLTTGRILFQFHTGTMTRRTPILEREYPEPYVEINPQDAEKLGVRNGWKVGVETRRGRIELNAAFKPEIKQGTIFIPFHFSEAAANRLTNPALDPVAGIPEYKACAAKVVRL